MSLNELTSPEAEIRSPSQDPRAPLSSVSWSGLWKSCQDCIRDKVSPDVFSQWILPLRVQEVGENSLVLGVPDPLDVDHLARVYAGLVEHCFHESTGRRLRAQFRRQSVPQGPLNHAPAVPFSSLPAIDLNPNYTF